MKPEGVSAIMIQIPRDAGQAKMGRAVCLAWEIISDSSQHVDRAGVDGQISIRASHIPGVGAWAAPPAAGTSRCLTDRCC